VQRAGVRGRRGRGDVLGPVPRLPGAPCRRLMAPPPASTRRPEPDDDLGLFGPGSVTWRVHAEPILAVAGLRALYFQGLHPRAMAGMAQNSAYKSDPWGRLMRTVRYVGTTVYGT